MRALLSIGIDNYPGSLKLKGRAEQAAEFATLLSENEGETENFQVKVEKSIYTAAELTVCLRSFFAKEGDTAVLYFTGHGLNNDDGSYLVTPDYGPGNEGVSMDSILRIVNRSRYRNKIVILDCCHSGAFGSSINGQGMSAEISNGTAILSASTDYEKAYLINGKGIFTNLLLDALRGDAADMEGNITPGSVYAYIDRFLGPFDQQRPVFKANVSNFTVLRKVIPKADVRKLVSYFEVADKEYPLDPSYEFSNTPDHPVMLKEPYKNDEKVAIFKILQRFQSVGFVEPVDEEFMYYAAMNAKSCRLTKLGQQYWRLVKNRTKNI